MIPDCNEIIEAHLWVGRFIQPEHMAFLRRLKIDAIVNLQSEHDFVQYQIPIEKLLQLFAVAGIEFRHIPVMDFNQDALSDNLPRAVHVLEDLLRPKDAKVYLHCTAGINRGPTLAAAYLMKSRGFSPREAYEFIKKQRRCEPYLSVLEGYERFLKQNRQAF